MGGARRSLMIYSLPVACLVLWNCVLLAQAVKNCSYPAIYNFGDSLSDVGNAIAAFPEQFANAELSPNGIYFPMHAADRYCDGKLLCDFIGKIIKQPAPTPHMRFSHFLACQMLSPINQKIYNVLGSGQFFLLGRNPAYLINCALINSTSNVTLLSTIMSSLGHSKLPLQRGSVVFVNKVAGSSSHSHDTNRFNSKY